MWLRGERRASRTSIAVIRGGVWIDDPVGTTIAVAAPRHVCLYRTDHVELVDLQNGPRRICKHHFLVAGLAEAEVGVHVSKSVGVGVAQARAEHHCVLTGIQNGTGREFPFVGVVHVVRQEVSGQIKGSRAGVVQLNPVVFVAHVPVVVVGSCKFVDHHLGSAREGQERKQDDRMVQKYSHCRRFRVFRQTR